MSGSRAGERVPTDQALSPDHPLDATQFGYDRVDCQRASATNHGVTEIGFGALYGER